MDRRLGRVSGVRVYRGRGTGASRRRCRPATAGASTRCMPGTRRGRRGQEFKTAADDARGLSRMPGWRMRRVELRRATSACRGRLRHIGATSAPVEDLPRAAQGRGPHPPYLSADREASSRIRTAGPPACAWARCTGATRDGVEAADDINMVDEDHAVRACRHRRGARRVVRRSRCWKGCSPTCRSSCSYPRRQRP